MRFEVGRSCISSRVTSICVGSITTFLWLTYAYGMAIDLNLMRMSNVGTDYMVALQAPVVAALICSLISSALSVLMVFGTVKRIANYMFPWLAIHFVLLIFGISMSFSFLLTTILTDDVRAIFGGLAVSLLIISILIYVWSIVYQHYKELNAQMQIAPTCVNEGKILKTPNEPENPYHSV